MVSLRDADPDVVKTAIVLMIEATFDGNDWVRLGMATNTVETIGSKSGCFVAWAGGTPQPPTDSQSAHHPPVS